MNRIKVFIHMDDEFGFVKGKEKTLEVCRKVREEPNKYGWLVLEEKSPWEARQSLMWTGFRWDIMNF